MHLGAARTTAPRDVGANHKARQTRRETARGRHSCRVKHKAWLRLAREQQLCKAVTGRGW